MNFTAFKSSVHVFSWISLSLEDGHDIVLNLAVTDGLLTVLAVCNLINCTSYELCRFIISTHVRGNLGSSTSYVQQ